MLQSVKGYCWCSIRYKCPAEFIIPFWYCLLHGYLYSIMGKLVFVFNFLIESNNICIRIIPIWLQVEYMDLPTHGFIPKFSYCDILDFEIPRVFFRSVLVDVTLFLFKSLTFLPWGIKYISFVLSIHWNMES